MANGMDVCNAPLKHWQAVRRHSQRRKNHHCLWTIVHSYYLLPSLLHGTEVFAISLNFMVACWSSGMVKIQSRCFRDSTESTFIVCAIGHSLSWFCRNWQGRYQTSFSFNIWLWTPSVESSCFAMVFRTTPLSWHVQRWCCEVWLLVLLTQFDSNHAFYESFIGCPVSW